jgi:hypothetical protein
MVLTPSHHWQTGLEACYWIDATSTNVTVYVIDPLQVALSYRRLQLIDGCCELEKLDGITDTTVQVYECTLRHGEERIPARLG